MSAILICGGSVLGLATGLMLARDGHDVTVLENDPAPAPATPQAAWGSWQRRGVPQFRQPHNLFPRFRQIVETDLPDVQDALLANGCVWHDLLASLPPTLPDQRRRPDDDRFRYITGRRPVVERAFAEVADRQEGLTVRRGQAVAGFSGRTSAGTAEVTGVVTEAGERLSADLVIDAMGRRSPGLDWLVALGATRPYLESSDIGFVYYTRYFTGPDLPRQIGPPAADLGTFSILTLPGDNGTWSITLFGSTRDSPFKQVREPDCFSRLVRACPAHAHWLQGEPVTDVLPMAGVLDRYRRFVVDDRPVTTGYAAVGDAWACTNPSAGRGLSVGLMHAQLLRDVLGEFGTSDADGFARAFDARTQETVAPWFWAQKEADASRFAEISALRAGREPEPREGPLVAFAAAMAYDEEVIRAFAEVVGCLALPSEVLARPGLGERISRQAGRVPMQMPAPSREKLVELLG